MNVLYVAWQDPESRQWFPVGKLSHKNGVFRFVYTKGATRSSNFRAFGSMSDLSKVYRSHELFPLFSNRLISKKRPEYRDFLNWLDVLENDDDPLVLLARTEGLRGTDSLTVFPCPERSVDGKYIVNFFSHGLSHLPDYARIRIHSLREGDRLYLMPDPQNQADGCAIALRTDDPNTIVGYCPRYISYDFLCLLTHNPQDVDVRVRKVNTEAPLQLRLLCRLTAEWPLSFDPCATLEFQELSQETTHPEPSASHVC